ncbi:hypothetical protein LARI1_G002024 [Lachnellula arida]|uniref:Uncharacterized protein n=1 Tax=Lachnellula arida TaxID=1316785 RepID=A0A8T9BI41_9HELO|nr:hypothetical protein LARI1_G002024 [Lachnellula arida]
MFSLGSAVLVLLFLCRLIDASIDKSGVSLQDIPRSNSPKLTAISVRSNLRKREDAFKPKCQCEHNYADHTSVLDGGRTRIAKTLMEYKLPALNLEDIEMSLEDIQCFDSTIKVEFAEVQMFNAARDSWNSISEFLIIASHFGCNEDGERSPYLVSDVHYDHEALTAAFAVRRIQWKESYKSMTVKFGMSHGQYGADSLRSHEGLRLRRAAASSPTSRAAASTSTPKSNSSIHADVGFQVPSNQAIFTLSNTVGTVTDSATVKCGNCSVSGTIDIVEGEFTVSNSTTDGEKAIDFINTGFFRAVANNLGAHVELDTTLSLSTTQSFNKTLTSIGLPGFEIPGIATVGPFFRPVITGSLQIQGAIDFTYGFDLKVGYLPPLPEAEVQTFD